MDAVSGSGQQLDRRRIAVDLYALAVPGGGRRLHRRERAVDVHPVRGVAGGSQVREAHVVSAVERKYADGEVAEDAVLDGHVVVAASVVDPGVAGREISA